MLVENLRRALGSDPRSVTTRGEEADRLADRLLASGRAADPATPILAAFDRAACRERIRRQVASAAARSRSRTMPGTRLACKSDSSAVDDLDRRGGAARASATRVLHRHGTQCHHQHAGDLGPRLGRICSRACPLSTTRLQTIGAISGMDFPTRNSIAARLSELRDGSVRPRSRIAKRAVVNGAGAARSRLGTGPRARSPATTCSRRGRAAFEHRRSVSLRRRSCGSRSVGTGLTGTFGGYWVLAFVAVTVVGVPYSRTGAMSMADVGVILAFCGLFRPSILAVCNRGPARHAAHSDPTCCRRSN